MTWFSHLDAYCIGIAIKREPDFIIKREDGREYIRRWYLIPHNTVFNIYYHVMLQSDDDRAHHDHKAHNISLVTVTGYWEHINGKRVWRPPGSVIFRRAQTMHRIELVEGAAAPISACSVFIKFPDFRRWGYGCPQGWTDAADYNVDTAGISRVGKGCG